MSEPGTRAVRRRTKGLSRGDADDWPICVACGEYIKLYTGMVAPHRIARGERADTHQVICNIYVGRGKRRRWDRVEHWHESCFDEAGQPVQPYITDDPRWENA